MDYIGDIKRCVSLEGLFSIWKSKDPEYGADHKNLVFISDGIVDPATWNSGTKKKILFVLKEAYDCDKTGFSLSEWLHTHPRRRIWNRIARITRGLQNTIISTIARYKSELSDEEYADALDQIAVMNLKKRDGKTGSDYNDIVRCAKYDREELKKEFELINADIVVCGYTFEILHQVVFGNEELDEKCDNWYYWLDYDGRGKRLFIDYYHPAIHDSDLLYYYGLIGIYQQALIEDSFRFRDVL